MLSTQKLDEKSSVQEVNQQLDNISSQLAKLEHELQANSEVKHSFVPPHVSQEILDSYLEEVKELEVALQKVGNAKKQLESSTEVSLISHIDKRMEELEKRLKVVRDRAEAQRQSNLHMDKIREARRNQISHQHSSNVDPAERIKAQKESMARSEIREAKNKEYPHKKYNYQNSRFFTLEKAEVPVAKLQTASTLKKDFG